jgi:hypothetical protein
MGYLIQVPPNPLEWVAENNSGILFNERFHQTTINFIFFFFVLLIENSSPCEITLQVSQSFSIQMSFKESF